MTTHAPNTTDGTLNARALSTLLDLAADCLARCGFDADEHGARLGVIRGSGPAASFTRLVERLESEHSPQLKGPFEGTVSVEGHVWRASKLLDADDTRALLKLRFVSGTGDLPLHAHPYSDRCLFVLRGRGFFHATAEPPEAFTPSTITTTAVRERDVIVFPRGTVHTFSAPYEDLVLLSAHFPYIPLEDARQYRVTSPRTAGHDLLAMCRSDIEVWMGIRAVRSACSDPITSRCTARARPS